MRFIFITLFLFSFGFFSTKTFAQQNMIDVLYLKNGSIIRGYVIEQIPNKHIKIQTKDGSIFVFKMDEVIKTIKEIDQNKINKSEKLENELRNEVIINRIRSRKNFDLIGLILVYGLTIVGDLSIGNGLDYPIILIPGLGPVIASGQVDEDKYINPNNADRDQTLFLISGIIQTAFIIDYIVSSKEENRISNKISYNVQVNPENIKIGLNFNF